MLAFAYIGDSLYWVYVLMVCLLGVVGFLGVGDVVEGLLFTGEVVGVVLFGGALFVDDGFGGGFDGPDCED